VLTLINSIGLLVIYLTDGSKQSVSLTNQLNRRQELQDFLGRRATELENSPSIFNVNLASSQWDSRRLFKFFDFVLSGDKFVELSEKYTVCIASQSSLEKLHSLVQVSQHWSGPISVSIFIAGEELLLTELYVAYLRHCFSQIRERISFHLAFSKEYSPTKDHRNFIFNYKENCNKPEAVLSYLLKQRNPEITKWKNNKLLYPQNHLRNHARRNCKTEYVFLTDVDIIPSIGMADDLDTFLRKSRCEKLCAYVIPVYEIEEKVSFPQNKSEMIKLAKNGLARPFHQQIYKYGHYSTNYNR
jgi:N-acetyllactosaminide beta-1,3-N-acetylglucosaminyltransferase